MEESTFEEIKVALNTMVDFSIFNLVHLEEKVSEYMETLSPDEFEALAVEITNMALAQIGYKPSEVGVHFLREKGVIKRVRKYGLQLNFYQTPYKPEANGNSHRSLDYWVLTGAESILTLDDRMNRLYRQSRGISSISTSFVLLDREWLQQHGTEVHPATQQWARAVLPNEELRDLNQNTYALPPYAEIGLGSLDPLDIVNLRDMYTFPKISYDELSLARERERDKVSDPFLSKPLTRHDQIYMLMRFLESLKFMPPKSSK